MAALLALMNRGGTQCATESGVPKVDVEDTGVGRSRTRHRARVHELGYGDDNEEQEEGLQCITVPVFERFGRVIAGLQISFPGMRCGADTNARYIALLKEAGRAISAQQGYHDSVRAPD